MNSATQPLQLLLVFVAGWTGRRQQELIEPLAEEDRVLEEQLRGRRSVRDLRSGQAAPSSIGTTPR